MNIQYYAPDGRATSAQDTTRIERRNTVPGPVRPDDSGRGIGVRVDAYKLWAGGAASAIVAGLVSLVGVLVSRWLFHAPVLAPSQDGAYGDVRTTALIAAAMAATLAATAWCTCCCWAQCGR